MDEYRVGPWSFNIYNNTIDVLDALCTVRDYMVQELLGGIDCTKADTGCYEWELKDGRVVELRVTVKDAETEGTD